MAGLGLGNYISPEVGAFIDRRRNTLAGFGAGLLQGRPGSGVQEGIQADDAYAVMQKAEDERQQNLNQTQQWIKANFPQYSNLPTDQAWQAALGDLAAKRQAANATPVEAPSSVREWEYFNGLSEDQQGQYLRMKRANPYLDIGTGFVQPDPVNPGQMGGPVIAKDNFTPAYDAAAGGAQAKVDVETKANFDSLSSKLPGLKNVVTELGTLAEKATYTTAGKLWDEVARETGQMPSEGALARTKYLAMVDNQVLPLLRDTFGAAFTVQEGESLRATLGAPDKTPAEKKMVLEAFIEQKARDLEALQARLPGGGTSGQGWTVLGVE